MCPTRQSTTVTVIGDLKPWPHRASASVSALTLGLCLKMGMMLIFGVGCAGVNQCGPLQASTLPLTLTLGVVRPLSCVHTSRRRTRKRKFSLMFVADSLIFFSLFDLLHLLSRCDLA